jgi:hypothetical protein
MKAGAAWLLAVTAFTAARATTRPGGPVRTFPTAEHARRAEEYRKKAADARNLSSYYGALAAESRGQTETGSADERAHAAAMVTRYQTMAHEHDEVAAWYEAEALRQEAAAKTVGAVGGPAPREDADY